MRLHDSINPPSGGIRLARSGCGFGGAMIVQGHLGLRQGGATEDGRPHTLWRSFHGEGASTEDCQQLTVWY
jgi:hypothetical protein